MGIGQRRQVKVTQLVTTQASAGNWQTPTDGESFTTWAEVTDLSNDRRYVNDQTQWSDTKRFLIRYNFDNSPGVDWKVTYDGREYTISEKVKVDERRFYWQLTGQCLKSQ